MKQTVRNFLKQHEVCGERVIVAVSGGADSVSLLLTMNEIAKEFDLELYVGHFDHRLRAASTQDANWVQELCGRLQIACSVGTPDDVSADLTTGGIEETARKQRYEFLQQLAKEQNTRWLAVAHTADDQAETVLHHIARGTGLKGLQGIPAVRKLSDETAIIRPYLQVHREMILEDLSRRKETFLQDESNSDPGFTRNRIRHEVLPYLRETLNPQIDVALRRLAQQAAETQSVIEELAQKLLEESVCRRSDESVGLSVEGLRSQPKALLTALFVQLWIQQSWPRQNMTQHHWERLANMILLGDPKGLSLPKNLHATLRRNVLEIRFAETHSNAK